MKTRLPVLLLVALCGPSCVQRPDLQGQVDGVTALDPRRQLIRLSVDVRGELGLGGVHAAS